MPRDPQVYLEDMLEAATKILTWVHGLDRESFLADERTIDAVIRNLEVIGEAAKSVPAAARDQCPEIEWRKLAGLRDVLIHQYFGVDAEIVWDVIESKLPALRDALEKRLGR